MLIRELILPEFDQEMKSTRKVLERVPEDKYEWTPHPKSTSMGALATHLANLALWGTRSIETDRHDVMPTGGPPEKPPVAPSRAKLLELFDGNVEASRRSIAGASDGKLAEPWSLLWGGKPLFTLPRHVVLRSALLNHMIHHRAQLTVYLRLCEVPVPAIYGPSADEGIG